MNSPIYLHLLLGTDTLQGVCSSCEQQQYVGQHQINTAVPQQPLNEPLQKNLCKATWKSSLAALHTPWTRRADSISIHYPVPKGTSITWCSPTALVMALNVTLGTDRCAGVPSPTSQTHAVGSRATRPSPAPPASCGMGRGWARLSQAAWVWLSVDQIQLFHKVSDMPSQLQQSLHFAVKSLGYLQ